MALTAAKLPNPRPVEGSLGLLSDGALMVDLVTEIEVISLPVKRTSSRMLGVFLKKKKDSS